MNDHFESLVLLLKEAAEALEPFMMAAQNADDGVEPDLRCEGDYAIGDASWEIVTLEHCRTASEVHAKIKKVTDG